MQMYKSEDAQLANVKAVLLRLQRLASVTDARAVTGTRSRSPGRSSHDVNRRRAEFRVVEPPSVEALAPPLVLHPSFDQTSSPGVRQPRWLAASAVFAFLACIVGLSTLVEVPVTSDAERHRAASEARITIDSWPAGANDYARDIASVTPLPTVSSTAFLVDAALGESARDLAAGQVVSARNRLLSLPDLESADVSWALARAYDPNVLRGLSLPDASPNPEVAGLWYRRWRAQTIAQGQAFDDVMLQWTIRSMH